VDTSKEYIEMCRNEWIQECRGKDKWEDGDFYTDNILINHPDGFGVHESQTDEPYEMYYPIWLPRQDQLQDMLKIEESRPWKLHEWFDSWWNAESGYMHRPSSLEIVWLSFVMHEKFNKKWDGKEWIAN